MIAGRSGSAKSSFALWLVMKMELRTLYYSADMSPWQASVRLAASQKAMTIDEIEVGLADGSFEPPAALPVQFCFDSSPNLRDIYDEMDAYVEAWGKYPELIVVDNLKNCDAESDGEYGGQNLILDHLHGITRQTGAAVIVLHHTQLAVGTKDPFSPQPRWAIKNNVDELPNLILQLGLNPDTNEFQIACTKQSTGAQDIEGKKTATLMADLSRNTFGVRQGFWS